MEVYIDDMLVKSLDLEDHLKHLQETFKILRKYSMKLNPEKCTFGVGSGKFLGFLVSNRGIKLNPDKIKAIEDIPEVLEDAKVMKDERMQRYSDKIQVLLRYFKEGTLEHVSREHNAEADDLENLMSSTDARGINSNNAVQLLNLVLDSSHDKHPSANGQAQSTYKTIVQSLRKRLESAKSRWREVLPQEFWAHRTITKSSTSETPFSLVYGAEALILVEIWKPSLRYSHANEKDNSEALSVNLDPLEEYRETALLRIVA
ncbi:uncharacterized protein LOC132607918 [Lycium barbarum]|uniref:uncharacterized protein LOC132607918 n=1 Tax=Lycium barbarum TaxID=112863 RepID=UPI00293F20CD|nr:uncharacterized protein LOC132607918 [Lycium barbarum]